ncbi:MAG: threonine synthase, partial [Deltaproteobacteria bacterium]|nr:threonine synthase [Deltaproteobacteria bacterium]
LRSEGIIAAHERVVVIATAHGAKFASTTLPYHLDAAIPGARKNPPRVLEPTLDAIRGAI